ncbi:MAG: DUF4389 domain-containing protein [Thermomicrobiales bacterium]|nr:DUF4389 domain-containing protein [Thermomicrobiales bacterium]
MSTRSDFYLDIPRAPRLSRLLIFIKWLLILPHSLILYVFSFLAGVVGFVAWFAILFTGTYPQGMWDFVYQYMRWSVRVSAYTSLLRDEYPPFSEAPYPVDFSLTRPEKQSRLLLFVRWVSVIPLAFWLMLVGIAAGFALLAAWFCILFTGNIPESIREFIVGFLRYGLRVQCYLSLLTDAWPGFSLE